MLLPLLGSSSANAVSGQFVCTINGIYTLNNGVLTQRTGKRSLGKKIFVNKQTGEVTGAFGTDGAKIIKIKRPDGILSVEMEFGVIGDLANLVEVSKNNSKPQPQYNFYYKKNWLHITGLCE